MCNTVADVLTQGAVESDVSEWLEKLQECDTLMISPKSCCIALYKATPVAQLEARGPRRVEPCRPHGETWVLGGPLEWPAHGQPMAP